MHDTMSHIGAKTSEILRSNETCWQDGYYDTRVRTARQFAFVINYIEQNPVAKALVDAAEDWDATSANRTDLVTETWPYSFD